ncbi:triose-phosphate isomerase [Candidatus Peribacteria bacterium RIFCSPHIGHO2_02_FULL_53_20]|nr:MAG: triose-phosphate isomerase [Candidatus Peribacteria bacterium RIFCSPHIGHO2_02_FULL_53_20]OGJ72507.1 MAG: triose-phosphate isomerase [Candidatus Peribacteria bacterium RIFCSPLOWO2_12_FULL_53_10]
MSERTFLLAANWKMNPTPAAALVNAHGDQSKNPYHPHADIDVVVFPTFLDVQRCMDAGLIVGAQYGHPEVSGAHTGDVSMAMLKTIGCRYVLCGHSERRNDHKETDNDVAAQAIAALEQKIHPIICIGETLEEREKGHAEAVVKKQLKGLPLESDVTIAYEPVWAIGTGKTATPTQAQEMHAFIRSQLPKDRRDSTRILYGGSMKVENAEAMLKQPDIDGGLIGGASLKPEEFGKMIEIAEKMIIN